MTNDCSPRRGSRLIQDPKRKWPSRQWVAITKSVITQDGRSPNLQTFTFRYALIFRHGD